MAIDRKPIQGSGILQLRSSITTERGSHVTETQTWTGPYDELLLKLRAEYFRTKSTSLSPSMADGGVLTLTYEWQLPDTSSSQPAITTYDVTWQTLSHPLQLHPMFDGELPEDIAKALRAAQDPIGGPALAGELPTISKKLYNYLIQGITEYNTGVPLVRRTTTGILGGTIASGNAWIRESPPVTVSGTWQWLKTADERRSEAHGYTRTEEWTAAKKWDPDIYP